MSIESLLPFLGIPLSLGMFFLMTRYVMPMFGGWKDLAQHYSTPQDLNMVNGEKIKIRQVKIGKLNTNNIVRFRKTHKGLFLSQLWIFRGKQPNLLIPWSAFGEVTHHKVLWHKSVRISVGRPEVSYLEMSEKDYRKFSDRVEDSFIQRS